MSAQPNLPLLMSGVHAYSQKSVKAGETVNFRISTDAACQLSVCKLGADPDSSILDTILQNYSLPVGQQPIRPGSYVHVENRLPPSPLGAFSIECWVRPFRPANWSGVITQYTYPTDCGLALLVGNNQVHCYLGGGGAFNPSQLFAGPTITSGVWTHVVVTWNGSQGTFFLNSNAGQTFSFSGPMSPGFAPLRLGAYGEAGLTDHFLDGDIAMPVVYNRALTPSEVAARFADGGLNLPSLTGVLGCWPLNEEVGAIVSDASGAGRHGTIVNHASWMIGGPTYQPANVPRYGGNSAWSGVGHGLRFAVDDLYDCGWNATASYAVPVGAKSGLYVGRIRVGAVVVYEVPFIVQRPAVRPKAEILVLAATNTWAAYSQPFNAPGPGFNCYELHAAGQPTFQIGMKMPMMAAGIHTTYPPGSPIGYSHLVRAERYLHQWLERCDYSYDMATDLDLHRDPTLLSGYKVLVINGHSEYWSSESWTAVEQFLNAGNGVVSLSGNTMFWRVSFDATGSVMECRKFDGGQTLGGQIQTVGEIWHSHDGKRGGLMRECGFPAWKILGLDTAGFAAQIDAADFMPFSVAQSSHFLFNTPNPVGVSNADAIGQAPGGSLPLAVGHEYDARLINLLAGTTPPPGAVQPTEPAGITTLAQAVKSTRVLDFWGQWATGPRVCSEIIYWERPAGTGIVFNVGTIGAGWALSRDVQLQKLLHNVLHRLGVTVRPGVPSAAVTSQGPTVLVHRSLHGALQDKRRSGAFWLPSTLGWNGVGSRIVGPPALLAWSTYVSALAVGAEGELLSRYWDGLQWGPSGTWQGLGGTSRGALAVVSRSHFAFPNAQPNAFDVFALGQNGSIQRKWWDGSNWGPSGSLEDLGGSFIDSPAAINWGSYLTIMGVWTDGTLRNKYRDGFPSATWPGSWGNLGGSLAGPLAITSRRAFASADFDVFALGRDGAIHRLSWVGGAWSGWVSMGGSFVGGPAAVPWNNGTRISLFAVEGDGELRSRWWDSAGGWSASWDLLPGAAPAPFLGPVHAINSGSGRIDLFAVGTDRALWTRFWDGSLWQPWSSLGV